MEDEKLLEEMENKEGFFHNNDYHIIKNEKEDIVIKVNITPNSLNPYGSAHGGLIFGLGDTVMGIIAYKTGKKAVTLDANINYLKPGLGKYLIGKGKLVKKGKNTCFIRSDIYNDKNDLIATMSGTYYYIS